MTNAVMDLKVYAASGSWYVVSDDYVPASVGHIGSGVLWAKAYDTREEAIAEVVARRLLGETKP